jgi:hypothetical protein
MDLQTILEMLGVRQAQPNISATDEPLILSNEEMKKFQTEQTDAPDGAFDGEFAPENEGAQFPDRVRQRPFANQRPSENVEVRQPGNLLDTLDYAEQRARRGIINVIPEALRTSNMQDWMTPENDPDRYKGQPDWFGRSDFHIPTPMETTQIKREAARPGDPAKPYPEMTDELYGAAPGPQASLGQALLAGGMKGDMPLPPVPLPPPRPKDAPQAPLHDTMPAPKIAPSPKDSSRLLKDLFGEAATVPSEPQGDVEATDPADLALLAKMGVKNLDLPQAGKVMDPNQLNKDPGPAFWDEGKIDKYAASGIATNPDSPIAEFFRQQAVMALGGRNALLEQLRSGEGEIR